MQSSSLVEVEVAVGVEVGVGGGRGLSWAYFFGRVVGVGRWVGGDLESKAYLNSSCS